MADNAWGIHYPELSDAPNVPADMKELGDDLSHTPPKYGSAGARGSALTGGNAPIEGDLTYLSDVKETQRWNGSAWVSTNNKIIREVNGATGGVLDATPTTPIAATAAGVTGKRLVQVTANVDLTATAACGARAFICNSGGGEEVRMQARIMGAGNEYRQSVSATKSFVVTGSASYGVRILREGGSGQVNAVANLQILDLGPVL